MKRLSVQDIKPILERLERELKQIYKERFKYLLLYGSYARGEATEDSDIDLLVVLDEIENPFREKRRYSEILWKLCLENNLVISAIPVGEEELLRRAAPVFMTAREEGVKV